MKIWNLRQDLTKKDSFFTKLGKIWDLAWVQHIKMDFVQNQRKIPAKAPKSHFIYTGVGHHIIAICTLTTKIGDKNSNEL